MSDPSDLPRLDRYTVLILVWGATVIATLPFIAMVRYMSEYRPFGALSAVVLVLTALGTLLAAFRRAEWLLRSIVLILVFAIIARAVLLGADRIELAVALTLLFAGGSAIGAGASGVADWMGRPYALTLRSLIVWPLLACVIIFSVAGADAFAPIGVFVAGFALAYAIIDERSPAEVGHD